MIWVVFVVIWKQVQLFAMNCLCHKSNQCVFILKTLHFRQSFYFRFCVKFISVSSFWKWVFHQIEIMVHLIYDIHINFTKESFLECPFLTFPVLVSLGLYFLFLVWNNVLWCPFYSSIFTYRQGFKMTVRRHNQKVFRGLRS